MKRIGDMDLTQDLQFQRREWSFQLGGFVFLTLLIGSALLGFFGEGPVSLTSVEDESGDITVTYERFGRRGTTFDLRLEISSPAFDQGEVDVRISSDYLDNMRVENVIPAPDKVTIEDGDYIYTFLGEPTERTVRVTFSLMIDSMWGVSGRVGLADGPTVDLDHFFFP